MKSIFKSLKQPYYKWYINLIQHTEIIRGLREKWREAKEIPISERTEEEEELITQIEVEISKYETSKTNIYNEGSRSPIFLLDTCIVYLYIWGRGLDANNLNPTNVKDIT